MVGVCTINSAKFHGILLSTLQTSSYIRDSLDGMLCHPQHVLMAPGLFLRKMGKRLLSDVCSLPLHAPELLETSHSFWVYLKGRVGAGEISLCASADGLMFNRKPCGHK